MDAGSNNWRRFCAAIAAYRRSHRSWPNRAMMPRAIIEEFKASWGAEVFSRVNSRVRLFPGNRDIILVYDEQCQVVDETEQASPAEIEEIQRWLGVGDGTGQAQ